MQPIAVAIVHGIEIEDPDFATTPTKLLKEAFADQFGPHGPDPDQALIVEPIAWAAEAQARQQQLFDHVFATDSHEFFEDRISRIITKLNAGSTRHLVPLILSMSDRKVPGMKELHWPTARWLMMHFVGDVIAYDRTGDGANYHAVHGTFASGLESLARRAGPEAPLCVIAHSFGTVLATDYFYDQQQWRRRLAAETVDAARGKSALARGHTLAWLYTMGSPLALWSLRYASDSRQMSKPIRFPGQRIETDRPDLNTEWVNIYEKDDIIAYPLRGLSEAYAATVDEDRAVDVSGPVSTTPLTHIFYWSDRKVIDPIGARLAQGWRLLNE